MRPLLPLLAACTIARPVPGTQPCEDTAVAISARTMECTGDGALANARYDAFFEQYTCASVDFATDVDAPWYDVIEAAPGDWWHCAWAVGELPCELVESYGDDLDQWLTASPVCPYIIEGSADTGGAP